MAKPTRADELGDALRRAAGALRTGLRMSSPPIPPEALAERATSEPSPAGGGIDRAVLDGLQDLMGDELNGIVTRFVGMARDAMPLFDSAIAQADANAVYESAHRLTASAGMLGAMALSTMFRSLMNAASDTRESASILAEIRKEWSVVEKALAPWSSSPALERAAVPSVR